MIGNQLKFIDSILLFIFHQRYVVSPLYDALKRDKVVALALQLS